MYDPNPTDTLIPVEDARRITASINAVQPSIVPSGAQASTAVAVTPQHVPDLSVPQNYYAVWKENGFCSCCKNVADSQIGYPGSWAEFIRDEYAEYAKSHEPASQYGLPEGLTWYYV